MVYHRLTAKQTTIIGYLELNLSDEQIAERMQLSRITIRGHIKRLCKLYRVRDRTALMHAIKEQRIRHLESTIEHVMDAMSTCTCDCCDAHYRTLEKSLR